jgi:hypothetical protein
VIDLVAACPVPRSLPASPKALNNSTAFKFRGDSQHMNEAPGCWDSGCGIEVLLLEIQTGVLAVEFVEEDCDLFQVAPQTVNRPSGYHVTLLSLYGMA